MKRIKQVAALFFSLTIIFSCKKGDVKVIPLASLHLTNAIMGGNAAKMRSSSFTVASNNYAQIGLYAGSQNIYIYPVGDSLHPYFNDNLEFDIGETCSIFLCGQATGSIEWVRIKESIPYRTDSTAGIRFINLSPNSNPLNITLLATPKINEISNLGYKQYTEFKSYPGLYNSSYTFQIRDASTADPINPLATFSLTMSTVPRFSNITLVIRPNGNGISVFRVNNDR